MKKLSFKNLKPNIVFKITSIDKSGLFGFPECSSFLNKGYVNPPIGTNVLIVSVKKIYNSSIVKWKYYDDSLNLLNKLSNLPMEYCSYCVVFKKHTRLHLVNNTKVN